MQVSIYIYMDQRCQRSDLSFSAGEGLGEGVDDQLIGELEKRICHGRGPIGIVRCWDGLSTSQVVVASQKSKVKSQKSRGVASTAGDASWPWSWT